MTSPRTLRDDMAMAALTGLLSARMHDPKHDDQHAENAYSLADAMLRAREDGVRDTEPQPPPEPEAWTASDKKWERP